MFEIEIVKQIHNEIIKETGGFYGLRDENLLISSLKTPFQSFQGKDLYLTTEEKAAKLLELIIKGNKRTAYVLFRLFLEEINLIIKAFEEEKYKFIMSIASGKLKFEEILNWIKINTEKNLRGKNVPPILC